MGKSAIIFPSLIAITRVQWLENLEVSWVLIRAVDPCFLQSSRYLKTASMPSGSRPVVGSSRIINWGFPAIARAICVRRSSTR